MTVNKKLVTDTRRICGVLLALLLAACGTGTDPPSATLAEPASVPMSLEVQIDSGLLAGSQQGDLKLFRGIPYASAQRWRPPQPASPWQAVLDATDFGPYCPQNLKPGYSAEALAAYEMSEDCLRVNVWTPAGHRDDKLPVMVWILPGSFRRGATQLPRYNGAALARQGVIVVTFDYRLGLLGQFAHPALARQQGDVALGNYHLMDQVAALQWVQRNIGAFGGDPGRVTIFGMSAGGVSVNYLMAMPAAAGLFQGAISQSSAIRVSAPRGISETVNGVPPLETTGLKMAEHFGAVGSDAEIAQQLREIPLTEILAYQGNPGQFSPGSLNPVLDGRLVVASVGETFRAGKQQAVPYLAGATSWEGSLVSFMRSADPILGALGMSREQAGSLYGGVDDASLLNLLQVDIFFGSQHYLVKQHAHAQRPAWLYYFSRVLEAHQAELRGAGHGAETPYVFKTLDALAPPTDMKAWGNTISESDRSYAEQVSAIWVQFAKTGNPNGPGMPDWPAFTTEKEVLLEFGQDQAVPIEQFEAARMKYWEERFESGAF